MVGVTSHHRCRDLVGTRPSRRVAVAFALAVTTVVIAIAAAPAGAHAELESSTPADGERLPSSPGEVVLVFTGGVEADLGGVRVVASDGSRVDDGAVRRDDPRRLAVGLDPELADGTYLVSYRVTSDDGHVVTGGVVFAVGDVLDAGAVAGLSDDAPVTTEVLAFVARSLGSGGVLFASGLSVFVVFVHDGGAERRRLVTRTRVATGAAASGLALAVMTQASLATGLGLVDALRLTTVRAVLRQANLGWSIVLTLVGLAAVTLATSFGRSRPARALTVTGCVTIGLAAGLHGHTTDTPEVALAVVVSGVHVAAGGVWAGGLAGLATTWRARSGGDEVAARASAEILNRFSSLAALCLLGVALTGGVLAKTFAGPPAESLGTSYGNALGAKVAIVLVVVALAAWNRYRLVPEVGDGLDLRDPADADKAGDRPVPQPTTVGTRPVWRRLLFTVRAEAALLVLVELATAVLVDQPPSARPDAATTFHETLSVTPEVDLDLVVSPAATGRNTFHLTFLEAGSGGPTDPARSVTVSLRLAELDLGPIEDEAIQAGPGHFVMVSEALTVAGDWEVTVRARLDEFTEVPVTATVPIR